MNNLQIHFDVHTLDVHTFIKTKTAKHFINVIFHVLDNLKALEFLLPTAISRLFCRNSNGITFFQME